ncbi:hypothetical protein F5883DRAFT_633767 [Diaporthe sp. PMI_573]|nr:hypothetical protein F5883DRAFT_633767 [Diaporthaceae sp. PMI_573]
MSLTSLLLNRPIPQESIELGRLVLDPKYPNQDFCQPSFQGDPGDATNPITPPPARTLLTCCRSRPWPPHAPPQLSPPRSASSIACQETKVRAWLEEECKRPKSTVYLVCGFKALTDARVEPARHHETDISVSVAVPAAVIAGAAAVPAPIPLDSGLDVGGSPLLTSASSEKVGYTAAGEQVFAVQYRKIRFSRAGRAGKDVDDGADAEVAEPIALPDLTGKCESFALDSEIGREQ